MDKKTIAHGYDNRTGGTILLKHAQYAINNERMLMARNSEIDLENVFKRMNDRKFSVINWKGSGFYYGKKRRCTDTGNRKLLR